jgi:hypothetical protein
MAETSEDRVVVLLNCFPGPLALRPSTWKWLAFLSFGIAALVCSAWLIRDPGLVSDSGWALVYASPLMALGLARDTSQAVIEFGWFAIVFLAIGCVVCIIMLLPGAACLTLDRDGFVVRSLFRNRPYRWLDTDEFAVVEMNYPVGRGSKKFVGFNDRSVVGTAMAAWSVRLAGRNSALPDTYGLSVDDLAHLMSRWRGRALS